MVNYIRLIRELIRGGKPEAQAVTLVAESYGLDAHMLYVLYSNLPHKIGGIGE